MGTFWKAIAFLVLVCGTNLYSVTEGQLKRIPEEDKEILSHFFKSLLSQGNFALTLMGYRPSSILTYQISYTLKIAPPNLRNRFLLESKGWEVWERYKDDFHIRNFLFLKIPSQYETNSYSVLFVNKKVMNGVLSKFPDLWQESSFEERALHIFSDDSLENSHYLRGLILGYGEKDSKDFQEMTMILNTLGFFPYASEERISACTLEDLIADRTESLVEKKKIFETGFRYQKYWGTENPFFCTKPCGHLSFNTLNISDLDAIKHRISVLYNSDSFLEKIITLLEQ